MHYNKEENNKIQLDDLFLVFFFQASALNK